MNNYVDITKKKSTRTDRQICVRLSNHSVPVTIAVNACFCKNKSGLCEEQWFFAYNINKILNL